jgi:hypothetical protein
MIVKVSIVPTIIGKAIPFEDGELPFWSFFFYLFLFLGEGLQNFCT